MKVKLYATLRRLVGSSELDVPLPKDAPARALLDALLALHPTLREELLTDTGNLRPHVHLFLDGKSIHHLDSGLDTRIPEGTKIDLFPPVAGG